MGQPPSGILRLMSLELAKGSVDLLELLGQQTTSGVAEAGTAANGSSGDAVQHDLARIFSMPFEERNALIQSLQQMHGLAQQSGQQQMPNPPPPVSSSSMNSSGNLPDPFASLGLNSGDWLSHMLGVGAGGSLQNTLPPDAPLPPLAVPVMARQETLAKLPAKTTLLNAPLGSSRNDAALPTSLGTSAAGRVSRKSARAAAAASDGEDEDTPFADFVPAEAASKDKAGSTDDGARATTGVRRKAPDVDWRDVSDPEERKRLRRMAKNRRTAAASRERKKAALDNLVAENNALKARVGVLEQQVVQERVARTAAEAEIARLRGLLKQQQQQI